MIRTLFLTFGLLFIFELSYAQQMQINNVTSYTVPGGQFSSSTQGVVLIVINGSSGQNYYDCPVSFNVDGNQWTAVIHGSTGSYSSTSDRYSYASNGTYQVSVNVNNAQNYTLNVKSYVGYTTVVKLDY